MIAFKVKKITTLPNETNASCDKRILLTYLIVFWEVNISVNIIHGQYLLHDI